MTICFCRSATSRKRRPGEVEGVDYSFVSTEDFQLMINGRFMEYAVFDHYYGTPKAPVEKQQRPRCLFDIDWQDATDQSPSP